jgi:hypothetical protein
MANLEKMEFSSKTPTKYISMTPPLLVAYFISRDEVSTISLEQQLKGHKDQVLYPSLCKLNWKRGKVKGNCWW